MFSGICSDIYVDSPVFIESLKKTFPWTFCDLLYVIITKDVVRCSGPQKTMTTEENLSFRYFRFGWNNILEISILGTFWI